MVQKRIPPPPPPSLPREAPWREIEAIVDGLKDVAARLDAFIALYTGRPVPVPPPTAITPPTFITPAPPELAPLADRLDALIAGLVGNLSTIATGQKDVATAGTPEQLDDLPIPAGFKLTVIAKTANTGFIYLGKNKGECANNKRRFDGLGAGLAVSLRVKNASAVWVDASVTGDGVSWIVESSR